RQAAPLRRGHRAGPDLRLRAEAPAREADARMLGRPSVRLDRDVDRLVVPEAGQRQVETRSLPVRVERADRLHLTAALGPEDPDLVMMPGGRSWDVLELERELAAVERRAAADVGERRRPGDGCAGVGL